MIYQQCTLDKKTDSGKMECVSWIPTGLAKVGKEVRVKFGEGWDDKWFVREVHPGTKTLEQLPDPRAQIKAHRRATGDSLAKQG